jgi:hypothetical protein
MSAAIEQDGPPPAPPVSGDARAELGAEFLHGEGLEIGALHQPMALPKEASVRYVDRMGVDDLRRHYPELADAELAPVQVIDDGERLATIGEGTVDFIVANHFLEHCEDPIGTITTHLTKLRSGGVLFYAVPDKRYTFDFRRPVTSLEHVVADHEKGPARSRGEHYLEWASLVHGGVDPPSEAQAEAYARQLEAAHYSIHFHVWTGSELTALLLHIQELVGTFELEATRRNGIENIVVLRKHTVAPAPAERGGTRAAPLILVPVPPTPSPEATRDRITLAGLRMRLDDGSRRAHWSIDPDGTLGRGLVQEEDGPVRFGLVVSRPLELRAQVRLLPHDWLDGTRAARAQVQVLAPDGRARNIWSAKIASASAGGEREGVSVRCVVPAGTAELRLSVDPPRKRDPRSVARVAWMDPVLVDPAAEPDGPTAGPPPTEGVPPRREGEPLVSVLLPVHDPPLEMLREAVDSVLAQTFEDWQLCLVDDGSTLPEVVEALNAYASGDLRVTLSRRPRAGGISVATNAALALATGAYVALLDHDDRITPNALALVAARVAAEPELDMLYTDEGILDGGRIAMRSIKPGWSPESLVSFMYTCHLGVYRRTLVQELGALRPEFDGCQDYDLVLRIAERTDRVAHIPAELYQWRAHAASTAGGEQAKPYAYLAQPRALAEHLARRGIAAEITLGALPGMHGLRHRLDPDLQVAIVVAADDPATLEAAAPTWTQRAEGRLRVAVAAPNDVHPVMVRALREAGFGEHSIEILSAPAGDSAAGLAAAAQAALTAGAGHLVVMERPCAALSHHWLDALVGTSTQPGVAVAGAVVLADDGRVAEAGVAFPEGIALPLTHGIDAAGLRSVTMNTTAAAGVLAVSAATAAELGPLDPGWAALMLPEFCVRAAERGLRTAVVADVRLQLTGSDDAVNDLPALWRLRRRWLARHFGDRFYNPRFRADRADFEPRVRL